MSASVPKRRFQPDKVARPQWRRLVAAMALVLTATPAWAQVELYVKRSSLEQTLLDTRARLDQSRAAQEEARRSVTIGPWYWATVDDGARLDPAAVSRRRRATGREYQPGQASLDKVPQRRLRESRVGRRGGFCDRDYSG